MQKTLLIIDGHSLVYRAFYALPSTIKLSTGQTVNAVYGFVSLLFNAYEKFNPTHICICFDRKEPTFRHKQYPEYKAHRPPAPDDLISQIPILKEFIRKLQIPIYELAGYEADDLIGTISAKAEKSGFYNLIMTGDRDSFQLISDSTNIIINKKGVSDFIIYNKTELKNRYDLTPTEIIDFKALQGDPSDNIPGVAGVGKKTAINLIKEYHTLDNIYQNLEKIKSKSLKTKLELSKNNAYISQKLVKIDRNSPLELNLEDTKFQISWNEILQTFKSYEFKSLIKKYSHKLSKSVTQFQEQLIFGKPSDGRYELLDLNSLKSILSDLKSGFAFDTETTQLKPVGAQLVGISFAIKEKHAYYLPLNKYIKPQNNHIQTQLFKLDQSKPKKPPFFPLSPELKLLKPIFQDPKIPKYTHNGKYDIQILLNYGIHTQGIAFDTMLAAYLLYPGERIGLKELTSRFFDIQMTSFQEITNKEKISFDQIPIKKALTYAGADADFTLRLKNFFLSKIKEKNLENLLYNIEIPLQEVLTEIEFTGVDLDVEYLHSLHNIFSEELNSLSSKIYEIAGIKFKINSPKQLSEILFKKLKLPTGKKTKEGYSTDASVLEKLAPHHEIAKILLRYRTLDKLLNTYVDALPQLVNTFTHKIHASFNQAVTVTGRLSSSNPNLQNIPAVSEDGQRIRGAFIGSEKNNLILSADYSQIELRLLAHLANDPVLINAFQEDQDIHQWTASLVFHKELSQVTKEERYKAKAVNFGIIYGIQAYSLSEQLGISYQEADQIIKTYFDKFPRIRAFINETIEFARKNKFVKTEYNRIRPILDIDNQIKSKREFAKRIAMNTRVQGTSADIMKIAMINIFQEMKAQKLKSKILIQVHDELVFDVFIDELEKLITIVTQKMQTAVKLKVPLKVNIATGKNWKEAK